MAEHSEDFAQRIEMALRTGNRTRRDDVVALLAAYERQQHLLDRLLRERETHLTQVEAAFRRRHNEQLNRIRNLEQQIKDLKAQRKGAVAPSSDECGPVTSGGHCGCWVAGGLCCMCSYGGSKSECFGPCEAADDSEDDRG